MKSKDENEWILQADYDFHAAEKNLEAGVNPYAVFMCHLCIEKALKAVYYSKLNKEPPRIHDLLALYKILNLQAPDELASFIRDFSASSVPARYPDELKSVLKEYDKKTTAAVLKNTGKVLKWIKEQLARKS